MRTVRSTLLLAFGAIATALTVGCAATPTGISNDWIVVESPYFEIMSTLDGDKTIGLAEDLERFRALIYATTTAPQTDAPVPSKIFAFKRKSQFARFNPWRGAAGYFQAGTRANNVVLTDYSRSLDAKSIIFHEYVHFVLRNGTGIEYPIWYDEGFAEVLSTVRTHEGKLIVGAIPKARIPSFQHGQWISMERIIEATSYADFPEKHLHMFYAEAWALAHYVTLDQSDKGSIEEYLSLLNEGVEPTNAFEQAFSERIASAASAIKSKLKRGDWRLIGIPIENLDYDRRKPVVRKPSRDEVALRLGQLQLSNNQPRKAQALFEAALAANGENDRAHAGLGDALKFQSQTDAAGPHFHTAVGLGPNDPLNHLDLAEYLHDRALVEKRGAERTRLMAEARGAYETALELDSTIPETYMMLGRTYLAAGEDASEAIPLIERAFKTLPSQDDVVVSLAEAYIATERHHEARKVLRRAASSRRNGSLSENLDKAIESIRESRVKAAHDYMEEADTQTQTSRATDE